MRGRVGLGLAAALVLASCAGPMGPTPVPVQPAAAPTPAVSANDQAFVTAASKGNLSEVALGKLALAQSHSARVRAYAQEMIDDHQSAETQLEGLAARFGATVATAPDTAEASEAADLGKLSGRAFDRAYVADQVKAHTAMLAAFRQEASTGDDADLKAYADSGTSLISHHLEEAQGLAGGGRGRRGAAARHAG